MTGESNTDMTSHGPISYDISTNTYYENVTFLFGIHLITCHIPYSLVFQNSLHLSLISGSADRTIHQSGSQYDV